MTSTSNGHWIEAAARLAEVWEARRIVDMRCRTSLTVSPEAESVRIGYLSTASDVERLLLPDTIISDTEIGDRIDRPTLETRLLHGEIVAFVANEAVLSDPAAGSHDSELNRSRQQLRRDVTEMHFLLRQFALDEIGSHRGASRDLVATVQGRWNDHMAVLLDLAMVLSLGADRQRYTDPQFVARFNLRIPAGHHRLAQLGVRSNPLLVLD